MLQPGIAQLMRRLIVKGTALLCAKGEEDLDTSVTTAGVDWSMIVIGGVADGMEAWAGGAEAVRIELVEQLKHLVCGSAYAC